MRDPDSGWIRLDANEFGALWRECGYREPPDPLPVPTGDAGQATATLLARDLGTAHAPAADLAELLDLLSDHERSLAMMLADGLTALVASSAGRAVAAASAGGEIRIGPITPEELVVTLFDAVPRLPGGTGWQTSVPVADYRAAHDELLELGEQAFLDSLRVTGLRGEQARTLLSVATASGSGGRVSATGHQRFSGTTCSAGPLGWVDTEQGRYALRERDDVLSVTPVDVVGLAGLAKDLLTEVTL